MLQKKYFYMQQIKNSNVSVLFSNILYCFKIKNVKCQKNFNIFTILTMIKILGLQKLTTILIVRLQCQTF